MRRSPPWGRSWPRRRARDAPPCATCSTTRGGADLAPALAEVRERRERCVRGASRRARLALEQEATYGDPLESEWLGYASVLVQVDRIVSDLSLGLPAGGPTLGPS